MKRTFPVADALGSLLGCIPVLLLVLVLGCMEPAVVPQKQPVAVSLSGRIKAELADRNAKLAVLAVQCGAKERTAIADEAKSAWNSGYHEILTNSVTEVTKLAKDAFTSAKTLEDKVRIWKELEVAYGP